MILLITVIVLSLLLAVLAYAFRKRGTRLNVVYCITCKGRAGHLRKTLPQNLANNPKAKFVLVNYNSHDDLMEYLYNDHRKDIESGHLTVYTTTEPERFKMAHAKNMAHRLGILQGADILVNLDADNLTGKGFTEYLVEHFETNPNIFMWARMIKDVLPRGISGRIAVSPDAFLKAGGYDEKFATWGRDDKDFSERLNRLGLDAEEIDIKFLDGIKHNDKVRFREYPHLRATVYLYDEPLNWETNDDDVTVVNYGRIGLGRVTKNFGNEVIDILPVPTRIFGIGMHKTGTTSLSEALRILGFSAAHWKSAQWARRLWEEMKRDGKSLTVEQAYAITDLPITILYKELDKAYPGSKFILTIRSESDWIDSVRKHWDGNFNKWRHTWRNDKFTHTIHTAVYGQHEFDEELFIKRYREHNKEVMDYFRDRPDDLLILDMGMEQHWQLLCQFLKQPIPSLPFPRLNMTDKIMNIH